MTGDPNELAPHTKANLDVVEDHPSDMVAPLDEIRRALNPQGVPDFEACAHNGTGVFETLKHVAKLVLSDLKRLGR